MNSNVSKICRTAETIGLFPLTNSIRICCIDIQTGLMCLAGDITPSVTHHSHTLRLRLETPIPAGIPAFSPGGKTTGIQSTGWFNRTFGTPRDRVLTPRSASFPRGNTPHLDRSGSNPPSSPESRALRVAREMRRTAAAAAAANGRPSSPPPSSPPPQLLLPHLHTFAFMAATTSTPASSPSPSPWPPAPHLQTVAQHLSVCSFPATPFSFSISSSFPLPIFSRVCLLLRIDLVKLMISSPAPPRCRVLRHHLSIADGISSLPQTLEVCSHGWNL